MKYLTISRCEDEPHFEILDKEKLEKRLDEGEYYDGFTLIDDEKKAAEIIYELPIRFPSRTLIVMKVILVIPKAVQKVTKYEIP